MFTWLLYKIVRFRRSSLIIHGKRIRILIADTFAKQLVGLMYRSELREDGGMLFVFGRDSRWGIWMANMRFSIDIIWIDSKKRVVDIKRRVKPCTTILNCKTYCPSRSARYVLELASGSTSRMGIRIGETISMPSTLLHNLEHRR
jgi:hypothetical protein